ncbi:hypothetical protein [Lacticaseibacillus salsurivasis]|uniref:hypothetical protein n=1 Tax=Lacticaseibacillus salsurivasis TaxID=3081441 RepID=UPI0030C7760C
MNMNAAKNTQEMIEGTRKCYVYSGDKATPAKFYGVYQVAWVVGESPFIGGHSAGQVMDPVAVVEYEGQLHKASLDRVHFDDTEVAEHEAD